MMIACMQRVPQWRFLMILLLAIPSMSLAQTGYSNPNYNPKKGQAAEVPSYSTPARGTPSSPPMQSDGTAVTNSEDRTMHFGVNLQLPVAIGDAGQGLKSKWGANAMMYLSPLLSDDFDNYLSVGIDMMSIKADTNTSFNVIPFAFGLELPGQMEKTFSPVFGIALGGAYAWIHVPNSQTFAGRLYLMAQVKPGMSINLDSFSVVLQTPITFLIGNSKMSYLAYSVGARFGL